MTEASHVPNLLPTDDSNASDASERQTERRWLLGIVLTTVLNLALTVIAFGGLWLQGNSIRVEQNKLVDNQLTAASELIKEDDVTAQAAGFRLLERIAANSPDEQDYVVDLAESFLAAEAYKSDDKRSVAKVIPGYDNTPATYAPNPAVQAAVSAIQNRNTELDSSGPGRRAFRVSGMVVEAVRFGDAVMRDTQGEACFGRYSAWEGAKLTGSNFSSCGFLGARFIDSDLQEVEFKSADLRDTDFSGSDLTAAHFDKAALDSGTVFRGADLDRATFADTDLSTVNFAEVKSIAGADFSRAVGVEKAQNLRNAPGNESARWPSLR